MKNFLKISLLLLLGALSFVRPDHPQTIDVLEIGEYEYTGLLAFNALDGSAEEITHHHHQVLVPRNPYTPGSHQQSGKRVVDHNCRMAAAGHTCGTTDILQFRTALSRTCIPVPATSGERLHLLRVLIV